MVKRKNTVLCVCCMEEHEDQAVTIRQKTIYKGVPVEFDAEYRYCDHADEYYVDEQQIIANDISMKNAYQESVMHLRDEERGEADGTV